MSVEKHVEKQATVDDTFCPGKDRKRKRKEAINQPNFAASSTRFQA